MDALILLGLIDVGILGIFAIVRTYLNYRSVKLQEMMLTESRVYWNSWKERSKDVARKVLEDMSTQDLLKELERREEDVRKNKEA